MYDKLANLDLCRVVQLIFTQEIEVLCKLFAYFNFRSKIQLDHPVLDFVAEFVRH